MNWFKQSQSIPPIRITGWRIYKPETIGTMSVSFNGGASYPYENISPREYAYVDNLLKHRNYSAASKQLRIYADRNKQQEQTIEYTPGEKQQMLDELEQDGLIGNL